MPPVRRGRGFEDYLAALRACWGPDPVAHDGRAYPIPPSRVGPKPVAGTIPRAIGAGARPAVERAGRLGLGCSTQIDTCCGSPWHGGCRSTSIVAGVRDGDTTATEVGWYRAAGGPGPVSRRLVAGEDVRAALARAAALGTDEIHWGLPDELAPADQVAVLERIVAAAG